MADRVTAVRESTVDGRAQTPRYKQRELARLHKELSEAHKELSSAICTDTGHSHAEAEAQYFLALHAVKEHYSSIDIEKLLEAEYSLANSKDNPDRNVPYGCVYIIPAKYSLLYSAVSAVSAAIASGNCVFLELPRTLSETAEVLRRVLDKALDKDSFAIVDNSTLSEDFRKHYCVVLDAQPTQNTRSWSGQLTTPTARTVAVVDRSADLAKAAKEIVRARFAFGGSSPYAPDIVLVNEFALKDFCTAVGQSALSFLTVQSNGVADKNNSKRTRNGSEESSIKQLETDSSITVLASGLKGTVALVRNRNSELLGKKVAEPLLLVHTITSMDDAIEFLNEQNAGSRPLAAYFFAAPAAAKYLSQFVASSASFTNHIPVELLVGSPAPEGTKLQLHPRYNQNLFTRAAPEQINVSPQSSVLADVVDGVSATTSLSRELDIQIKPIVEITGGAMGFFEQGVLLGIGIRLSTIIVGSVVALRYGYPFVATRIGWR